MYLVVRGYAVLVDLVSSLRTLPRLTAAHVWPHTHLHDTHTQMHLKEQGYNTTQLNAYTHIWSMYLDDRVCVWCSLATWCA